MTETQAALPGQIPVRGLTPPTQRTGAMRRIGDVIVMLGFAERGVVESVVDEGRARGVPLGQSLSRPASSTPSSSPTRWPSATASISSTSASSKSTRSPPT
jgi:hypothetical protein